MTRGDREVNRPAPGAGAARRQRYQIRVRGRLGQTIRSAFPALRARPEGGDTVLTGVLAEAEALGLELIEVRRLPPRDEPQAPSS